MGHLVWGQFCPQMAPNQVTRKTDRGTVRLGGMCIVLWRPSAVEFEKYMLEERDLKF